MSKEIEESLGLLPMTGVRADYRAMWRWVREGITEWNESPNDCIKLVEKAFQLAEREFGDKKRESGEELMTHPMWMAMVIVANMGIVDGELLAAVILHDVLEDTEVTEDEMSLEFGQSVTGLVEAVSWLKSRRMEFVSKESGKEDVNNQIAKVFTAINSDERVGIVKAADVAMNQQTSEALPNSWRKKQKALLALELIGQLAREYGMDFLAELIEEGAMSTLYPKEKQTIDRMRRRVFDQMDEVLINEVRNWYELDEGKLFADSSVHVRLPGIYEILLKVGDLHRLDEADCVPQISIWCNEESQMIDWLKWLEEKYGFGEGRVETRFVGKSQVNFVREIGINKRGDLVRIPVRISTNTAEAKPVWLLGGYEKTGEKWWKEAAEKLALLKQFYSQRKDLPEKTRTGLLVVKDIDGNEVVFPADAKGWDFAFEIDPEEAKYSVSMKIYRGGEMEVLDLNKPLLFGDRVIVEKGSGIQIGPGDFDFAVTDKALNGMRKAVEMRLNSRDREKINQEAWGRGVRVVEWLYESVTSSKLDTYLIKGFIRGKFKGKYENVEELVKAIGLVSKPAGTNDRLVGWQLNAVNANSVVADAWRLVENLVDEVSGLKGMKVLVKDTPGVLRKLAEIIRDCGGNVLPMSAKADNSSSRLFEVAELKWWLTGEDGSDVVDLIYERIKNEMKSVVIMVEVETKKGMWEKFDLEQ